MERVDRLILKAIKINGPEDGIVIISNETGEWRIGTEGFLSLEAAQKYAENETQDQDTVTILINDAGPGIERSVSGCGKNQIKNTNTYRSTPYPSSCVKHGGKRGNGYQKGEYNHSWV